MSLPNGFNQTFPVNSPSGLTSTVPSYLYWQYRDDESCLAFIDAYNALGNDMVAWFNYINLPIYTGLSGALLDWVANGLYGFYRPTLSISQVQSIASYGTAEFGALPYGQQKVTRSGVYYEVNDDIFKRMLTWHRYKGDGYQYSTPWLKRRVHRFLNGPDGIPPYIDQTYDVSVSYSNRNVTITVPASSEATTLSYLIQDQYLALPFIYNYTVVT